MQGAVGVVGRALIANAETIAGADPLAQPFRDPRLANPGFARQHDDLALAFYRQPPPIEQQADLVLAPDKRGQMRRPDRCEAGFHWTFTSDLDDRDRLVDPL